MVRWLWVLLIMPVALTAEAEDRATEWFDNLAITMMEERCAPPQVDPIQSPLKAPTLAPDTSPDTDTTETIVVTGIRAAIETLRPAQLPEKPLYNSHYPDPYISETRTLDRLARYDLLTGTREDITHLLSSLERLQEHIAANYDCFLTTAGRPQFHILVNPHVEPWYRLSLLAYAEAKLVYNDTELADRSARIVLSYLDLMAQPPPSYLDTLPHNQMPHDPYWTLSQARMEALQDLSYPVEWDILAMLALSDSSDSALEYVFLTEIFCAPDSAVTTGLSCRRIEAGDQAYTEIFNPALTADYIGPNSLELAPLATSLSASSAPYRSARAAFIAEQNETRRQSESMALLAPCYGLPEIGPCAKSRP